jgi:hypothetical protein
MDDPHVSEPRSWYKPQPAPAAWYVIGPNASRGEVHPLHVAGVFVFFSNRLGCAGSLLVTVVLSALLILLMRGCSAGPGTGF